MLNLDESFVQCMVGRAVVLCSAWLGEHINYPEMHCPEWRAHWEAISTASNATRNKSCDARGRVEVLVRCVIDQ